MAQLMNHEVAGWMARLAAAIEGVGDLSSSHGSYFVGKVVIGFDDEPEGTQYRIVPDEYGGYGVTVEE